MMQITLIEKNAQIEN